jgi:hypothetical protein
MPSELRHVMFRPAEVVEAVRDYRRRMGDPLSALTVVSCAPERDGDGETVRFRLTLPGQPAIAKRTRRQEATADQEVIIEGPDLISALILYCSERSIPLPAKADKFLDIVRNQVCLVISIGMKKQMV